MRFVNIFTRPDFTIQKFYTWKVRKLGFNISVKLYLVSVNLELLREFCKKRRCFLDKFTQLAKILHDRRSRRSWQISRVPLCRPGSCSCGAASSCSWCSPSRRTWPATWGRWPCGSAATIWTSTFSGFPSCSRDRWPVCKVEGISLRTCHCWSTWLHSRWTRWNCAPPARGCPSWSTSQTCQSRRASRSAGCWKPAW